MMDNRATAACGCRSNAAGAAANSGGRYTQQRRRCPQEQLPVMVYIVEQEWSSVYPSDRALQQGTLFPVLDKPFFGKGGCCGE